MYDLTHSEVQATHVNYTAAQIYISFSLYYFFTFYYSMKIFCMYSVRRLPLIFFR
jgi:hypothetical protein